MTSPFNLNNNSDNRFVELMKRVRQEYSPNFHKMFEHVSQEEQKAILEIENVANLFTGDRRKIFQIVRPKESIDVEQDLSSEKKGMQGELSSDEEQEVTLKRDRKALKEEGKKTKKKTMEWFKLSIAIEC